MTCKYCQRDGRLTGEHLIPMALIDLFPECEFNIDRNANLLVMEMTPIRS